MSALPAKITSFLGGDSLHFTKVKFSFYQSGGFRCVLAADIKRNSSPTEVSVLEYGETPEAAFDKAHAKFLDRLECGNDEIKMQERTCATVAETLAKEMEILKNLERRMKSIKEKANAKTHRV
jgi:hypothetical protein